VANKLLESSGKSDQTLTTKLEKLPTPSEEEINLLNQLNLTPKQYISISLKTPYLTEEEKEFIIDNYQVLNLQTKLQLISSGLNALEINTYEKKEKLIELINAIQEQNQAFGLSTKEKENILRFLSNTLNLSPEQKESLENMGVSFFNAGE
jgi:hypothetical protein